MFNIIEKFDIQDHHTVVSNKRKFKSEFLRYSNKVYKIIYNNIHKNDIYIQSDNEKITRNANVYDYKITKTIDKINVNIVDSERNEINENELLNNLYSYLTNLFVFDKMDIVLNDIKLNIVFNAFDKYYLVSGDTKIIINQNNKYKLYNNIFDIDNKKLTYIVFTIKHINGSFKRNLLDDINMINNTDLEDEIKRNHNKLYNNKVFHVISNNCDFEVKITLMNLLLDIEQNKIISDTIYNFTDTLIENKKIICDNSCVIYNSNTKLSNFISIIIENGPTKNKIYDLYKVIKEVNNKIKYNFIKNNDLFNIVIDDDILTIKIKDIDNDNAIYIDDYNNILLSSNDKKNIFAYYPELIHKIESIDVHIIKYTNIMSIFGLSNNKIPEVDIDNIINLIKATKYFKYSETNHYNNNMTFEYKNIVVKDVSELDKCLLTFSSETKINIIKSDDCNIKLIDKKIKCGNIELSLDEIKNIKNKLHEFGLAGMDEHIDKIIKEIILPRSNFIDSKLKKFIKVPKGIILYGPPGTGKTSLARNIGKILGISNNNINMINAPEIFSKYLGESEENVRKLFKASKEDKNNLHLLIIDECDSIFKSRDSYDLSTCKNDILNQFLPLLDGLETLNNIIIIGITNRFHSLDKAILRPGRMNCHIEISFPNEKQRLEIINLYHNKIKDSINFDEIDFVNLVKITKGFSGAEIENIYTKIIELVIEYQFNEKEITITNETFGDIIKLYN